MMIALLCGFLLFFLLYILIICLFYKRTKVSRHLLNYVAGSAPQPDVRQDQTWRQSFLAFIRAIAKLLEQIRHYADLDRKMQQAGLPILGSEFIVITVLLSLIAGIIAFSLILKGTAALLTAPLTAIFCRLYINIIIARRKQAFTNQLGDMLSMVADSMRAGFSFIQSIDLAAREMGAPIGDEFTRLMAETRMGSSMEQALQSMARRVDSRDFDLIVAAVLIQRQVGGNLAYIFDTISGTINARIRMKREVKTLTAQGRLSGWILAALPVALSLLLSIINPNYLEPLITDPTGRMAIGAAVIMEIIGFIIIQRLVDIDV